MDADSLKMGGLQVQGKLKEALHNIWMAETQEKAHAAFDQAIALWRQIPKGNE